MNGQKVIISKSFLTFLSNGNKYDLNDSELSHFSTNTRLEQQMQNTKLILNSVKVINYIIYYVDKNHLYIFIYSLKI